MESSLLWVLASITLINSMSFISLLAITYLYQHLHLVVSYLTSFTTGMLLGTAFINLLPDAFERTQHPLTTSLSALSAIVLFFIFQHILHWHRSQKPSTSEFTHYEETSNFIAEIIHTLLDGVIIAGSYAESVELGVLTTLTIGLGEIPDEIGDFSMALESGTSLKRALTSNILAALASYVSAILIWYLATETRVLVVAGILPFAAGVFIYLALSNLVPQLQHEKLDTRNVITELIMVLIGIAIMAFIATVNRKAPTYSQAILTKYKQRMS